MLENIMQLLPSNHFLREGAAEIVDRIPRKHGSKQPCPEQDNEPLHVHVSI